MVGYWLSAVIINVFFIQFTFFFFFFGLVVQLSGVVEVTELLLGPVFLLQASSTRKSRIRVYFQGLSISMTSFLGRKMSYFLLSYFSKVCLYEQNPFSPSLLLSDNSETTVMHVFQRRRVVDKVLVYCVIVYILSTRRTQERKSVITLDRVCALFLVFLLCNVQVFLVRCSCRHNTHHGRHVFNLSLVYRMLEFDQSLRRAFNASRVY